MKRRGLTLLEVIVGSAVLALVALPLLNTLLSTHRSTVALQEDVAATLLALELVDQVKLAPLKFVEGLPDTAVPDGAQPLLDHFRRSPLHAAARANPAELAAAEALLTLRLSPLPPGYERTLSIGPRQGFFSRVTVKIRFKPEEPGASGRERTRAVTGLLVGGA